MPTGPMRRVRSIVTGVAGSPYYLNAYFDASEGSAAACILAWHTFLTSDNIGSTANLQNGATLRTDGETPIVNPVDGSVIEVQAASPLTAFGNNVGKPLPPANQNLVRWRTGNYVGGREVRGRTNLPFAFLDQVDDEGNLIPARLNVLQNDAEQLIEDPNVSHVVWSKKNGVWWATQSASVWPEFSVLRSRRD